MVGNVSASDAAAASNNNSGHVVGIDSVRALAALSVVFAHIVGPELPGFLKHTALAGTIVPHLAQYIFTGHPAVIAFFVVSGFCIHYPYVSKPLPVLPFWVARLVRIIIPALVAMVLAKLARLHDYNFWDGYILWSVVCELFYYMLYPLFLCTARYVPWRLQFYIALMLSFALVIYLGSNQYGSAHIYGPLLNWVVALPSWLTGCVLAETVHRKKRLSQDFHFPNILFWRLLVAAVASFLYWATMNTGLGYYITMNGFALLVYFWIQAEVLSGCNENRTLERVGRWSYSIYLLHMPLIIILGRLLRPIWNPSVTLLCLPFVFYVSYYLYKKVESPAHCYARRLFRLVAPRGIYVNGRNVYSSTPAIAESLS